MFACQECGKKYKTAKSAEKAAERGCSKCGGVDIDLDMGILRTKRGEESLTVAQTERESAGIQGIPRTR